MKVVNDWFQAAWGVLRGQTDIEMDICDYGVAFVSENHTRQKENACKS